MHLEIYGYDTLLCSSPPTISQYPINNLFSGCPILIVFCSSSIEEHRKIEQNIQYPMDFPKILLQIKIDLAEFNRAVGFFSCSYTILIEWQRESMPNRQLYPLAHLMAEKF